MQKAIQPEDKWFEDGALRLHYLDWGNPGAPPLVLLHHHCGNAHYWDFLAGKLQRNHHVLAVDNRGHGDSAWMESYGPRDYTGDLDLLIDSLGLEKVTLLGHSLGGIVAILYTLAHPDKVSRLIIVDMGPEMSQPGVMNLMKRMGGLPPSFASEDEVVRLMKDVEPYYPEDFVRHLARYSMKRDATGRLVNKYDPELRKGKLGLPAFGWDDLPKITCPALVIHGAESELLLPEVAAGMAAALPQGRLVDIPRAGHNLPGDNPAAFEAAVRGFLS